MKKVFVQGFIPSLSKTEEIFIDTGDNKRKRFRGQLLYIVRECPQCGFPDAESHAGMVNCPGCGKHTNLFELVSLQ